MGVSLSCFKPRWKVSPSKETPPWRCIPHKWVRTTVVTGTTGVGWLIAMIMTHCPGRLNIQAANIDQLLLQAKLAVR